jgi:hypothetical protein
VFGPGGRENQISFTDSFVDDLGLTVAKGSRLYVSGEKTLVTCAPPLQTDPQIALMQLICMPVRSRSMTPAWLFELKLDAESFGREMG